MNRYIFLIILTILISSFVHGQQNEDSLFVQANARYSENMFEDAIGVYEQIVANGYESAELYFNLANSYYKTRNYPNAILNYERALLLDPSNEDIQFNLEKAKMYNIDEIEQIPEFIIRRWINGFISLVNANVWAVLSVLSFLLMLAFLLLYFFSMQVRIKKSSFYIGVLFFVLSLITFYFAHQSKLLLSGNNSCIAMSSTITVKSSPNAASTNLFIIHEGTKAFILDELDEWYEIRLSDGKQGWLLKSEVEPI